MEETNKPLWHTAWASELSKSLPERRAMADLKLLRAQHCKLAAERDELKARVDMLLLEMQWFVNEYWDEDVDVRASVRRFEKYLKEWK